MDSALNFRNYHLTTFQKRIALVLKKDRILIDFFREKKAVYFVKKKYQIMMIYLKQVPTLTKCLPQLHIKPDQMLSELKRDTIQNYRHYCHLFPPIWMITVS